MSRAHAIAIAAALASACVIANLREPPAILKPSHPIYRTMERGLEAVTGAPAQAEPDDAVHATTEADLAELRAARPTMNGAPIAGLRMRWCVAQDRCSR